MHVFVGTWNDSNLGDIGVSLFSKDLASPLTGDPFTVIEWYAPIVTIWFNFESPPNVSSMKVDGAKIEFEP